MRNNARRLIGFLLAGICAGSALVHAEPQLYETGPSEESSYVRFVNATEQDVAVISSQGTAKVELTAQAERRASRFFPVKSGSKLSATIQSNNRKIPVEVVGSPWEYITIAIVPSGHGRVKTMLVRETPSDFNAMRSSLALFNLDAKCGAAVMQGGAKNVTILDKVQPFSVQRRLVNPVKLSATVACTGRSGGVAVDLSQLQAGERYSVFLLTLKNTQHTFFVRD
ncbi:MAG: alginate O-acetyltransferase AlgF [Gallionella sp.]|nr:alginate O-acetyltransferase AlgF [Gallionella sp.]